MDDQSTNIYGLDIHIEESMATFKTKVGQGLNQNLSKAAVSVLSHKMLLDFETLQDLCGSYEGVVQVQFQIIFDKQAEEQTINILDILKKNEELEETSKCTEFIENFIEDYDKQIEIKKNLKTTKWIASKSFWNVKKQFGIPSNMESWTCEHVEKWLLWSEVEFNLQNLNPFNMRLSGKCLIKMSVRDFKRLAPNDPEDIFYMHFELLRKTHIVAVLSDKDFHIKNKDNSNLSPNKFKTVLPPSTDFKLKSSPSHSSFAPLVSVEPVLAMDVTPSTSEVSLANESEALSSVHLSGVTQHMQLWQFLLNLLTDPNSTDIISWCGNDGEFIFRDPEAVAKLWGKQKGKSNMNYCKLSRSLRYYYDSEEKMIKKSNGKKYVYKFELDLKNILGYDPSEIQEQILYAKRLNSQLI